MKPVKIYATLKEVEEQLNTINLELLFRDLVNYAFNKMKGNDVIEAERIVGDIFEKTVTGKRNWDKEYSFKSFLFLSVKSLVNQHNIKFDKNGKEFNREIELDEVNVTDSDDSTITEELKNELSEKLKQNIPPPDEIEEMVFECWMDEMKKPRDIAEFWELDVKEIYKAIKRLERKLNPIRELLNSKSNG